MKHGFMLIELIVATLIASMVAGILLAALAQSNRFQMVVDNLVDNSVRIGVISNQLEKDLMGAFIPVQAAEEDQKKENDSAQATKQQAEQEGVGQKKPEKPAPKPIKKIFYSTNKDGRLDSLTFITNNPLVVYVGKDVGELKPKVVRVQYSLKQEAEKKDSYALFRQESMELELEKYKNVREYEVIRGIKNCTATFAARIEKKDEKADTSDNVAKVSYEYKTLHEWVSEQQKETDKNKTSFPRIPYSVELKMTLWDRQDKKEKDYTIICHIPVDFTGPEQDKKKQPDQQKKEDNKTDAAAEKNRQQVQNSPNDGQKVIVFNGVQTASGKLDDLKRIFGQI